MVLPLLIAVFAAAEPSGAGVLFTSPRAGDREGLILEHQENWERHRPVFAGSVSAVLADGFGLSLSKLHRNLDTGPGREERFDLTAVDAGWWVWSTEEGAPAELGLAAMWSDSVFDVVHDLIDHRRSGERTSTFLVRTARNIGWFEPGAALLWTNRFFKGRRERLDDFVAGLSLRVRAAGWPLSVAGEWCPWIANPDHRPAPWSVSLSFGHSPELPLTVFATNTYGSTLANVTGTIPAVVWGARVSVAWWFRPPAE